MLRNRLLTAIVLIPTVTGSVILGGWWLFAVLGTALLLCGYEFFTMANACGHRTERALGVVLIAALLVNALLGLSFEAVLLIAAVMLPVLWEFRKHDHTGFLLSWALTVLGVVYIGVLGSFIFSLRNLPNGTILLAVALIATWATDSAAYAFGVSMGKRPFFKEISPKKTWEGAIGGVVGAGLAFAAMMSIVGMHPLVALAGGLGLGIMATAGDLAESLVKRQVGVKDSGSLLAGHGGVLDRLDSTLFAVAFAFYFFTLVPVG